MARGIAMMTASAYLDTNLVIGLARDDLGDVEQAAIVDLLDRHKGRRLRLVTSQVTLEELRKIPHEDRRPDEQMYRLLEELPTAAEVLAPVVTRSDRPHLVGLLPIGYLVELQEILDETDARHVFQALQANVEYFVTVDRKTILSRRDAVEAKVAMKFRKPSELVGELDGA